MTVTARVPARASTSGGPRTPVQSLVDVLCLVGCLALVLTPLLAVYGGTSALPAVAGGLLLGTAVAVASAVWRWSAVTTVAAVIACYALVGGPLAAPTTMNGVLPTRATLSALVNGPAAAWKQLLTLQPPVGTTGSLLVAALLLALVGSVTAMALTLRVGRGTAATTAALVPPAVMVAVIVLGTRNPTVPPVLTGTVLALVLLPWAVARSGAFRVRRVVASALLLTVAGVAGVAAAPAVVGQTPRLVVRDEIVPPFDPRDYPSPLAAFREFVKKDEDTTLFTVEGLPAGARVRLATMDRYDGVVWNVAGSGSAEASGEFRRVGDDLEPSVRGDEAHVEFTVEGLDGVWLPTVGQARSIRVDDLDAAAGLRYNDATGGAVLTGGVHKGLTYSADVVVPRTPDDDEIGRAPADTLPQPAVVGAPDAVAVTATDVARDAGSPVGIARSLTDWLSQEGYFSHGNIEAGDFPSLSGHGADRITSLLAGDVMVGDGEQYAAALALLAREMKLPARVVLGFVPEASGTDGPVEVHGEDVQAWVEIAFAGQGWVPFDPTPPRTQTPQEDVEQKPTQPDPQVVQPPPAPPAVVNPPDEDTEQPNNDTDDDQRGSDAAWRKVAEVAGVASVPLLVLASPFLVVGALKARRRRRRRREPDSVVRVAGGWDEVVDAARDLRRPCPPTATRLESAHVLASSFADAPEEHAATVQATVRDLARSADHAVFGAGTPDDTAAAAYWTQVEAAVQAMRSGVGWRRRWRSRVSTASLRHRRRQRRDTRRGRGPAGGPAPAADRPRPRGGRGTSS
ncbi:transglutaminase [Cellulomonas chitinilytica]|uniref:Transglutaminase n=1 Tax=Cellulomonas chitinilytica TaxID=398759 RepID=A0A919NYF0_9CELL|nr:transglutaminase domain-containing protein [Cellulomonas chitinilytica]GIG19931.1 transglutaminase [Cellulomonas chitinilytica]